MNKEPRNNKLSFIESHSGQAVYLAMVSMSIENRLFKLSYFWEPLSLVIVSTILGLIWGALLDEGSKYQYVVYVLSGFGIWGFMTTMVDAAANVFNRAHEELITTFKDIDFYLQVQTAQSFLNFTLVLPVVILLSFVWDDVYIVRLFLLLPFSAVVILTGFWLLKSLGVLCYFFPDLVRVVRVVMRMALLATPVLWKVEMLGDAATLVYLNPFFPYLDVFRYIVSSHVPASYSVLAMAFFTLVIFLLSVLIQRMFRSKLISRACTLEH